MRRIKTEVIILGTGGAAMLAASRLSSLGVEFVLINPVQSFGISDLRPHHGLGLWNAAYRQKELSLSDLYDRLLDRLKEIFPAPVEQSALTKGECWSVLSSTPIHRQITSELEKEFFKLERKPWSSGQFRLVNPENVFAKTKKLGIHLTAVAQVEGAVVKEYTLSWNAAQMGLHLSQFIHNKFQDRCFTDAKIEGRYGRRLVILTHEGAEISVESERALLIFLSGELLPHLKSIVAACDEPWIQGVRKRRREQNFVWLERSKQGLFENGADEPLWLELGDTRYCWRGTQGLATWSALKGPDGLERVVDEGLRLFLGAAAASESYARYIRSLREFWLEWDWKNPTWRETSHSAYWATSFEGDLLSSMELLWNLPLQ